MRPGSNAVTVVGLTVILQLFAATLLKHAAIMSASGMLLPAIAIMAAVGLHGIRFLLWSYAHRRWPLSLTYPMTAVFFPMILVLALMYGEHVGLAQIVGVLLITSGVAWLTLNKYES